MQSFQSVKEEYFLQDPQRRIEYEHMIPQYQLIDSFVELRMWLGFTRLEVAKQVGVSPSTIYRFEIGTMKPTLAFLYKLADTLGVKLTVQVEPQVQPKKAVVSKRSVKSDAQRKVAYPSSFIPKQERFTSRVSVPARTKIPA